MDSSNFTSCSQLIVFFFYRKTMELNATLVEVRYLTFFGGTGMGGGPKFLLFLLTVRVRT